MTNTTKCLGFLLLLLSIANISCRKEEFISTGVSPQRGLEVNSNTTALLSLATLKDGSPDNIVDRASCFSVKLPTRVIANGNELLIEDEEDYDNIEIIFEESDIDSDSLQLVFPITLVFPDYTQIVVRTQDELNSFQGQCPDGIEDDDIECVDIVYPLEVSTYNTYSEVYGKITFNEDEALHRFVNNLDNSDIVELQFPVMLVLADGSELEVADLEMLEASIAQNRDGCNENDDNAPMHEGCQNCAPNYLMDELFITCRDWRFTSLHYNGEPVNVGQTDLIFNFQSDGTLTATSTSQNFVGSWTASGYGFIIQVEIDVPGLEDFNRRWNVRRRVLRDGREQITFFAMNRYLRFQNACSN